MTNTIKLSLVAALAVTSLSADATDAIKNITVSGKAEVGYNYAEKKNANESTNETEYDLDLTIKSKVNDTVTAVIGFQADHTVENREDNTDAFLAEDKKDGITLTNLHFVAAFDKATVVVGKQKQPTPFFDDERGDGIVALVPVSGVTVAAGHFTGLTAGNYANEGAIVNLNIKERDVSALAVIGAYENVNFSAWYARLSEVPVAVAGQVGADAYSLNANTTIDGITLDARYSQAELNGESADWEKETLTKISASMNYEGISLVAAYAMTNDTKDDTRIHGVDLTADNDAAVNFGTEHYSLDEHNDADAFLLGATKTMGSMTYGVAYARITTGLQGALSDGTSDADINELDLTASYAMSKNFNVSALYATSDADVAGPNVERNSFELSAKYTF